MPIYEYKCDNCHHAFEALQSFKEDPLTKCPNCGKNKLKKQVSGGAGLIFKGSGFYLTDYKNKHSKKSSGKVIDSTTKETIKPTENKVSGGKNTKDK
jgi:putative FmdB family regulatory protein